MAVTAPSSEPTASYLELVWNQKIQSHEPGQMPGLIIKANYLDLLQTWIKWERREGFGLIHKLNLCQMQTDWIKSGHRLHQKK